MVRKNNILEAITKYLALFLGVTLLVLTLTPEMVGLRIIIYILSSIITAIILLSLYSIMTGRRSTSKIITIAKRLNPNYNIEVIENKLLMYDEKNRIYGIAFAVIDDIPYTYFDLSEKELIYKIKNFVNLLSSVRDEIILFIIKRSVNEAKFILNLERKISTLRIMRKADPTNMRIQKKLSQLEELYSKILRGERPIIVNYVLAVKSQGYLRSKILSDLDMKINNIMSALEAGLNIRMRVASKNEVEYILTFGLRGRAKSEIEVTSSHLAPFTPLSYTKRPRIDIEDGIYLGRDLTTETPVLINIKEHMIRHILILGPTGRGKTTLASILVSKLVNEYNMPCWIIDYRGEYKDRVNMENVLIIRADKNQINLLDYMYTTPRVRANQIVEALSIVKKLTPTEEYALLDSLLNVYSMKENPNLSDLIEYLRNKCKSSSLHIDERAALQSLITKLNTIYDRVFSTQTISISIASLTNTPVIFDLSTIPDEYRDLYVITVLQILLNYMTYRREHKLLVVTLDEAWRILRKPKGRQALLRFFKEGRGYGIIAIVITQDFSDIPSEILDNAGAIFAFGSHSKDYIDKVAKYMNLNEIEKEKMTWLKTGEALLRLYGDPRPLWIRIDEKAVI